MPLSRMLVHLLFLPTSNLNGIKFETHACGSDDTNVKLGLDLAPHSPQLLLFGQRLPIKLI